MLYLFCRTLLRFETHFIVLKAQKIVKRASLSIKIGLYVLTCPRFGKINTKRAKREKEILYSFSIAAMLRGSRFAKRMRFR